MANHPFDKYKCDWLPAGEQGNWKIDKFTVSETDSTFTMVSFMKHGRGHVRPGTYTSLVRVKKSAFTMPMMSDTHDEIKDHLGFIYRATGDVLIHGLGIGMCALAVARKPEVKKVLVIENSPDVIKLVAEHLQAQHCGKKIEVREADAFTWKPAKGERWNTVWHDVWPTLCADNLPEMAKLHRRFGRRCDWQGSWGKERIQDHRRQRASGW